MTTNWKRWICFASLCLTTIFANAATPMIYGSYSSSVFLNSDGSVWGLGSVTNYWPGATSPVPILHLPNVIAVAADGGADFALLADGTLWGSGQNWVGQLGDGTTQYRSQPQQILSGVTAVATNGSHVLALKEDGTVWAWGTNYSGQLGDGTQTDRYAPVQVIGLTSITKISAGNSGSIALKSDGTVWVWGNTCCGAAGNGLNPSTESDPEMKHFIPTQVHSLDQVVAIAAGESHNMALRADGTVWSWGIGANGENGTGRYSSEALPAPVSGLSNVVAIEAKGWRYSLALKADGSVWAWGNNDAGQFGVNGITSSPVPVQVPGVSDIVAISAGWSHILALRRDGTVLTWGTNGYGQLGDGTLQDRTQALLVSGPGGSGQLNLAQPAPASFNRLPQAQINLSVSSGKAPLTVQATVVNATDPDGTISGYSWKSSDGQQASGPAANFVFTQAGTYQIDLLIEDNAGGRGSSRRQVVVAPAAPVAVSVAPKVGIGQASGIALANDGRILTWGFNILLGLYDAQAQDALPSANSLPIANGINGAVDFAIGAYHVHVLLADGTVLGWGANDFGEAGVGSQGIVRQPRQLPILPPVQALAPGYFHNMALTRDGRVFVWGSNTNGQIGVGDNNSRFEPTEVTGLDNVIAIAAGSGFSVALKVDGTVWAWGDNSCCYQLGDGTQISRNRPIQIPGLNNVTKIFATTSNIFALKGDGTVWVTGYLPTVIIGDPGPQSGPRHVSAYDGVVQIAGDWNYVVALKGDGTVWTGGLQSSLALGIQNSGDIAGLKQVPGISDAIWVAAKSNSAIILRRDGTVLSWGINPRGQLGDGTLAQRVTPVAVVNEKGDGYLSLKPGTDFELPPSVGVPFFVVASGSVVDVTASVNTTTKFNATDVGKSGSVFITAAVPPGSLVAAQSSLSSYSAIRPSAFAASTPTSFVLIQLTSSGWQPVVNGQLIAYASGVLGDQLAAQTILNNTDTTNLKGAQFCLGYGASADKMIAAGTMRVVATIPDPNATGAAAPSCIVAGPPVSFSLQVPQGWNLLGNSLNQTLSVADLYGDPNTVTTVWKWDATQSTWQFYTPSMDAAALQAYAAGKGYGVLSEIKPGEGYWVNAKAQPTLATQSGASFILTSAGLVKGWNLVATGNDITPSAFNTNLKSSLPGTGVTTLWAWDNSRSAWYFYAPSLESQGGTALSGYIASKGYLDFTQSNKTLGNGVGFWANR